jgi:hypothetical protein
MTKSSALEIVHIACAELREEGVKNVGIVEDKLIEKIEAFYEEDEDLYELSDDL